MTVGIELGVHCPVDGHVCTREKCLENPHNLECEGSIYKLATLIRVTSFVLDMIGADKKVRDRFACEDEELVSLVVKKLGVNSFLFRQKLKDEIDTRG